MRIQRIQFLEKYAALAEDLLSKEYGKEYTPQDVEKLAGALIDMDIKRAAEFERVEEIVKQARYTAKGFAAEIDNCLGEGAFKKIAAQKTLSVFKKVRKWAKGSEGTTKLINTLEKKERKFRGFVKRDPYLVAGVAGGSLATGAAGTALID